MSGDQADLSVRIVSDVGQADQSVFVVNEQVVGGAPTAGAAPVVQADGTLAYKDLNATYAPATGIAESAVTNLVTDLAAKAPLTEVVYPGGNSGASVTLSLANGTIQTFTVSASCVFTPPTAVAGKSFVVDLTNGGAFTATFTGVKWTGGTAPTLTSGVGKRDLFSLICSDGSTWVGTALQDVR